jgi:hypothetical protein
MGQCPLALIPYSLRQIAELIPRLRVDDAVTV